VKRLLALSLALVSLTACHQFTGDAGALGFASNLKVDGMVDWSPRQPVASGTHVRVAATELLHPSEGQSTEDPQVVGRVTGNVDVAATDEPSVVAFTGVGRTSATVRFVGDAEDWFTARFAPVVVGGLSPEPALLDRDLAAADLALVPGSTAALCPSLTDRRGRSLGYDPADLTVDASGAVSAWLDADGLVHLAADGGDGEAGTVALAWKGRTVWEGDVAIVDASAADDLTITTHAFPSGDGDLVPIAVIAAWADGARLLGAPIEVTAAHALDQDENAPSLVGVDLAPDEVATPVAITATLGDHVARAELR
jgi:hypothetical protein